MVLKAYVTAGIKFRDGYPRIDKSDFRFVCDLGSHGAGFSVAASELWED